MSRHFRIHIRCTSVAGTLQHSHSNWLQCADKLQQLTVIPTLAASIDASRLPLNVAVVVAVVVVVVVVVNAILIVTDINTLHATRPVSYTHLTLPTILLV